MSTPFENKNDIPIKKIEENKVTINFLGSIQSKVRDIKKAIIVIMILANGDSQYSTAKITFFRTKEKSLFS